MADKTRCKSCGSTQTYVRSKTKERVCKYCGYIEKIEKKGGNE